MDKLKSRPNQKLLTSSERNTIYNDVATQLMGMKIYEGNDLCVWDLTDPDMKRFKIMMNLYRDTGKEFVGDIEIKAMGRKLVYKLYNDKKQKTTVCISKHSFDADKKVVDIDPTSV